MNAQLGFQLAVEQVSRQSNACLPPTLEISELEAIVAQTQAAQLWKPGTDYAVGAEVTSDPPNGVVYTCTTAGTSDVTPPVWPIVAEGCLCGSSGSVTDGTVTWQTSATYSTLFDTDLATSRAWIEKAGKASILVGQSSAGQAYQMGKIFDDCIRLAAYWNPLHVG